MYCLLIYDIPDDKKRGKIADVCQDYGLDRIQYSAFLGKLRRAHQRELFRKVGSVLGSSPGNIQMLSLPADVWEGRQEIDQKEEEEET